MSNLQNSRRAVRSSGEHSNVSRMGNDMLKNPAVVALLVAFGLVGLAAVIAIIMGIAEEAKKANENSHR